MCLCGFCNLWVYGLYIYCILTEVFLNLTEVFPCFYLSCKANARVKKLAKTGHGPNSSTLIVICVVRLLFVLFCVLFVCECVLPPGDNPIAVNKYIISYHIIFSYPSMSRDPVQPHSMPLEIPFIVFWHCWTNGDVLMV